MTELKPLFNGHRKMRLAIGMSGRGSNAEKIIERYLNDANCHYEPVLIWTDNRESNAIKIATEQYQERLVLPVYCNSFRDWLRLKGGKFSDDELRDEYDRQFAEIFAVHKADAVILAGYNWKVQPVICDNFRTFNVHPGDLRERDEEGNPLYAGLGWVPSAKAILDAKENVYTSVHIVSQIIDEGSVLSVSAPQAVPLEAAEMSKEQLFNGKGSSIRDIQKFLRDDEKFSRFGPSAEELIPLLRFARDCQERLCKNGDHIIFPDTLDGIAAARYAIDEEGMLHFDGEPIPNGRQY